MIECKPNEYCVVAQFSATSTVSGTPWTVTVEPNHSLFWAVILFGGYEVLCLVGMIFAVKMKDWEFLGTAVAAMIGFPVFMVLAPVIMSLIFGN